MVWHTWAQAAALGETLQVPGMRCHNTAASRFGAAFALRPGLVPGFGGFWSAGMLTVKVTCCCEGDLVPGLWRMPFRL